MGFKNTKFQSTVQLRQSPSTYDSNHGEEVWVDTQSRMMIKITPSELSRSGLVEYHLKDDDGNTISKDSCETRGDAKEKIKSECPIPVIFDGQKPAKRDNELFV